MENQNSKQFEVTEDLHATQGQRFLNYIIDLIIIYLIIFMIGIALAILALLTGSQSLLDWFTDESKVLKDYLLFFSVWIPYYTFFERYTSRTVGKFITKTMVVNEDGSKIDFGTAFKRTLCRIIPFEPFSMLGGNARGWHDSIPDTYVVRKEAFEEKKQLFYAFDEIGIKEE